MLDNPELVRRLAVTDKPEAPAAASGGVGGGGEDDDLPCQFPKRIASSTSGSGSGSSSSPPLRPMSSLGASVPIDSLADTNIDLIFIKITDLYSQEDYTIIYNTLVKIQNDPQYYLNYVEGLNKILEPVNIRIKKWIDDNIVF